MPLGGRRSGSCTLPNHQSLVAGKLVTLLRSRRALMDHDADADRCHRYEVWVDQGTFQYSDKHCCFPVSLSERKTVAGVGRRLVIAFAGKMARAGGSSRRPDHRRFCLKQGDDCHVNLQSDVSHRSWEFTRGERYVHLTLRQNIEHSTPG